MREEGAAPGGAPKPPGGGGEGKPPAVVAKKGAPPPGAPPPGAPPPPEEPPIPAKREPAYAMWVVIAGLAAIVIVFISSLVAFDTAADVTSATAGISGVIAALVGTYFGIRGSSLAQKQANAPENPPRGK